MKFLRSTLRPFLTLLVVAIAAAAGWSMWQTYMLSPWTRDGTVRVYVVTIAPEVAARVVQLNVLDNQYVHKGDVLFVIDPTDYRIAVDDAQAIVEQTKEQLTLARAESERRAQLTELAVTKEQQQIYATSAATAAASYQQALSRLAKAEYNLSRTEVHSPVDGWITNLSLRQGDYAIVGQRALSVVDAHSFWVDGYFEETTIAPIAEGDPASVWLMGFPQEIKGHVDSFARAINVPNAQPNAAGVAEVNPVFTWVRLAQRVPVRIHLDAVPGNIRLVQGMTATVKVHPRAPAAAKK
ncbi:MAG: HlyD family secretion protein [Beijerinckiaceae bacterium]|nr:HlyD family secretion protein [Beijerinckiaceae bacterium]